MSDAAKADNIVDSKGKNVGGKSEDDKLLAILSAIPIVGLIMYFVKKQDGSAYLLNYASQGAMLFLLSPLAAIPIVACIVGPGLLVGMIILMIQAANMKETYKLPLVGDIAEKIFSTK